MDFQKLLNELKALAAQCPETIHDRVEIELLEIEETLRNDFLID